MATTKVNGVELYYERHGTGDPVVLVHGGFVDGDSWAFLVPELTDHHEVIVYDHRGHSRSERPPGELSSLGELVDDLAALIEALDIAPAHVVGLSMGGTVALRLAAKAPDLVRALSVHEPGAFALLVDVPEAKTHHDYVVETLEEILRTAGTDPLEAMRGFTDRILPGAWDLIPDNMRAQMADNATYYGTPDLDVDLDALGRYTGPVLLTMGDATPSDFGWAHMMPILERSMKDTRLVTIAGAGHGPAFTHAAEYGALLRTFFAETTS